MAVHKVKPSEVENYKKAAYVLATLVPACNTSERDM